jgi:hypothetical protein
MIFEWPTTIHTLGDLFGARGGEHRGIDIEVGNGTPVHASARGIVTFAGLSGAYGNLIIIAHADGYSTRYGHLSTIQVHVADIVNAGEQIALSGGIKGAYGSGDATGPHLHFEIRLNGVAVDPLKYLDIVTTTSLNKQPITNQEDDDMRPYLVSDGVAIYLCVPGKKMIHIEQPNELAAIQAMLQTAPGQITAFTNLAPVQAIEKYWSTL